MNQPTTQQDLIDVAAKDYEASYYKHRSKHADPQDHFTAGAEWATTSPEVLKEILGPFAEWLWKGYLPSSVLNKWYDINSGKRFAFEELITKFIQETKQKEDDSR